MDKFCPSDLIEPGTAPLLLEQQSNGVHFTQAAEDVLRQHPDLQVGVASTHSGKSLVDGHMEASQQNSLVDCNA